MIRKYTVNSFSDPVVVNSIQFNSIQLFIISKYTQYNKEILIRSASISLAIKVAIASLWSRYQILGSEYQARCENLILQT